jgi:hypothetical protein
MLKLLSEHLGMPQSAVFEMLVRDRFRKERLE